MWMTKIGMLATVVSVVGLFAGGAGLLIQHQANAQEKATDPERRSPARLPPAPQNVQRGSKSKQLPDETNPKQYLFDCLITEVGKEGKETPISHPQLITAQGQTASLKIGQALAIPGKRDKTVEQVDAGIILELIPTLRKDGRLRVFVSLQITTLESQEDEDAFVHGEVARCVKVVKPGDTIRFELEKGGSQEDCYRVAITVSEASEVTRKSD
jgi:Flp pilus assembly secretin CpaC